MAQLIRNWSCHARKAMRNAWFDNRFAHPFLQNPSERITGPKNAMQIDSVPEVSPSGGSEIIVIAIDVFSRYLFVYLQMPHSKSHWRLKRANEGACGTKISILQSEATTHLQPHRHPVLTEQSVSWTHSIKCPWSENRHYFSKNNHQTHKLLKMFLSRWTWFSKTSERTSCTPTKTQSVVWQESKRLRNAKMWLGVCPASQNRSSRK